MEPQILSRNLNWILNQIGTSTKSVKSNSCYLVCSWFVVLVCVLLMLFCYVCLRVFLVLVGIWPLLLYLFLCVACVFICICVLIRFLEFDFFFLKLLLMCYLTVIMFIVLRCVMLFLCLNLFRGLDWWCSVFSCLFVFEVCGSLLLLGFRVELVFSLCVSWFVVWILGCCSGVLVFLLFCLRHYCSYSLFLVLEFDFSYSNLLFLLLVGFCVDMFSVYFDVWFEFLIPFLVLCSWIWFSWLKVLLVCVSTLFHVIGLCSVMLLVVLEFVLGSWWCSSSPSLCVYLALWLELLVVVLVPWFSLCVGSSLLLVFLVLCSPLPLLCPREPVNNLETYVLRAIREIWLQQIGRAIHRLDSARSVCVDAQPGHTQHVRQKPQGARCPTFHPHHIFTHNPHHLILKIYNKTTIIPHGSFHNTSLTGLVLLYGPCGHVISPPQQSQPHIVVLQRCVSVAWVDWPCSQP